MILSYNNKILNFTNKIIDHDFNAGPNIGLYSNFEQYFINGIRQASTSNIIRSNVSTARRLIVTSNIIINGFKLVRIPTSNWSSTTGYNIIPTLSVVNGTGASIDGSTSSKFFNNQSVVYNPLTNRLGGLNEYDIYTMRPINSGTTSLTTGEYNLNLIGTGANMNIAILTNSLFPIDNSGFIYPSSTATTTHFVMQIF